jgi:hypothetical protein
MKRVAAIVGAIGCARVVSLGVTGTASAEPVSPVASISVSAAAGPCTIRADRWAYCRDAARGTEYRYVVRCADLEVDDRFTSRFGAWRQQGGARVSSASCPPGFGLLSDEVDTR